MKTTVKKFLLTLSAVLFFTVVLCFNASAEELAAAGECGSNLTWSYNSDTKALVISGEGDMSYKYSSPFYDTDIKTVIIESGVTSIADKAFIFCESLESVTVPDSVTSIGDMAFYSCGSLKSVNLGKGVTSIDYSAFSNCTSLTEIIIPEGVTSISNGTFSGCTALSAVTIPEGVTFIGSGAFSECSSLVEVLVPYSVVEIYAEAFSDCKALKKVIILNPDCEIYDSYSTINASIIASYPGSEVEYYAERYSKTFEVYCPHTNKVDLKAVAVTCMDGYTAGTYCKDCCEWISERERIEGSHKDENKDGICEVCKNEAFFLVKSGQLTETISYKKYDNGLLVIYGYGIIPEDATYSIPDNKDIVIEYGISGIEKGAFFEDRFLFSLTIPDSVTSIGNILPVYSKYDDDRACYAVVKCSKNSYAASFLAEGNRYPFAYTDGTTQENTVSGNFGKFSWSLNKLTGVLDIKGTGAVPDFGSTGAPWKDYVSYVREIIFADGLTRMSLDFEDYYGLKSVVIPKGVTSIDNYEFAECANLEKVSIPEGVTRIGEEAFYECGHIKEINFPKSLKEIDEDAFFDVEIDKVYIEDVAAWCNVTFDNRSLLSADEAPTYNADMYLNGKLLTDLVIPAKAKVVNGFAFYGCQSITDVKISDGISSIGDSAFAYCSNMKNISIPDSVKDIENFAFYGNRSLESLRLPRDLKIINERLLAFCGVKSLKIQNKVEKVNEGAFLGNKNLETIVLPSSVKQVLSDVFAAELKNVYVYNKDCLLVSNCGLSYVHTIYGYKGSTAEKFADEVGATFVDITTVHKTHTYEVYSTEKATCASAEKIVKKCVCGKTTSETKGSALAHKIVAVPAKKATYFSTGLTEGKKCSVCGKVTVKQKKVAKKKLKKVTISSVKSTKKATALVTWKKITDASGYIVEYSTSKKFTKKTTKKVTIKKGKTTKTTLKKLKSGKKYYIRIKAFKTVNKKTVYGAYSSVKSVKIK